MTEEKAQESKYQDPIIFYCKDCHEVVKTDRCGRKYVYKCKKCGTKNVAFGTPRSIESFFRLDGKTEDEKIMDKSDVKKKSE